MGRTTAVVLLIAVVALSACSGGDDGVVVVRATSPVAPAPSATATATVTPTVAPSPAPPPLSAPLETSTPVVLTSAPTGEALAAPTHSGEVGVPLSANDVAQAVELDGRGYSFWVVDDRAPICSGSAVPGRPHWSANLGGSDFGPVFVLWVYRDVDALQQDWEVTPGEPPRWPVWRN